MASSVPGRPVRHTVATWTAQEGRGAVHFISRIRWRNQPRPTPSTPPAQIPQPFQGHTLPTFSFPENQPDACWVCQVPVIHPDTHEASQRHIDFFKKLGRPAGVAAAVQLLRRDRLELLAPAAFNAPPAFSVAEVPTPGPSAEHTLFPPVPAPRTSTTAPSTSIILEAEMEELETYFENNPLTPDAPDPSEPQA